MAETSLGGLEVANDAARCAAYNLETIVLLLEGQDQIKVTGFSLAALLRPVVSDMFIAHEELAILCKSEGDEA